MPVTLAQAALNTQSDIDYAVIDNLRRYTWLVDQITWDDTVTPGTGGAALNYAYTRLTTPVGAGFRAFNQEYAPGQAARSRQSVDLKPMGGAFSVDRALAELGPSATNEINFQLQQLLTSTPIRLQQEIILGDTAVDALGFDGLSKALVGTSTEKTAGYFSGTNDWTAATLNSQVLANQKLDEIDAWLSGIVPSRVGSGDMSPGSVPAGVRAILGNTASITRFKALTRWATLLQSSQDNLGRDIDSYKGWVLVDIGDRYDGASPIIPISSGGTTDLYAVSFGLDAFHGATVAGRSVVRTWMPDFSTAGAVKSGEVEIGPLAMVLKNTRSAAVLRGVKVQ